MYVITGATGHTGRIVAETLLANKHRYAWSDGAPSALSRLCSEAHNPTWAASKMRRR